MNRENLRQDKIRGISTIKKRSRKGLRLIPLSEEIKRELMEPDSGSSEEKSGSGSGSGSETIPPECIVKLIRSEVKNSIRDLRLSEIYVKKTDLTSIWEIAGWRDKNVLKHLSNQSHEKENTEDDITDEGSEDLEQKERAALNELENAFLADQDLEDSSISGLVEKDLANIPCPKIVTNNFSENEDKPTVEQRQSHDGNMKSSLRIMFTMTNNFDDSENTVTEKVSECSERPPHPPVAMKSFDSRLTVLEMKLSSLHRILQRIQLFIKRDGKTSMRDIKLKERSNLSSRNSIDMRIQGCIDDEIGVIEEGVQQSLFETEILPGLLSDVQLNPYDELYYEWRQYRMNMLHYRKSQRSIYLNQRPRIQQFVKPPCVQKIAKDSTIRIKRRPGFIVTPSRTKYKPVEVCA